MPATQFEQPARRIADGGGRGRLGLAAWVLALAAIVGAAVLGRPGNDDEAPDAVALATASLPHRAGQVDAVLVLNDPPATAITTVAVPVRGRASDPVVEVEVVLLRDRARIARQTLEPTSSGAFGGLFTLGPPRAAGSLIVIAIGRDRHGIPVLAVRQPLNVGALVATGAEPTGGGLHPGAAPPPSHPPTHVATSWSWSVLTVGSRSAPVRR